MDIHYVKAAEIKISHTYFKDGISDVFELIPLHETAKQLHNYNVLIDKRHNRHAFFVGLRKDEGTTITSELKGIGNLFFQLTINDVQWYNYTALKPFNEGQLLYFSNHNASSGIQQLHTPPTVTDENLLTVKPKRFSVNIPSDTTEIEVKNADGESIYQKEISNLEGTSYPLDLNTHEDGYYELWLNKTLHETFFASGQALDQNCIGIVKLHIKDHEDAVYTIDFKARAVYWKYKIMIPESRKIEVSSISVTQGTQVYSGPVTEEIVGGQVAQVFKSNTLMVLQKQLEDHPLLTMSYTSDVSHRVSDLEIKLPNPSSENISKEKDEESFFSSTIVYV